MKNKVLGVFAVLGLVGCGVTPPQPTEQAPISTGALAAQAVRGVPITSPTIVPILTTVPMDHVVVFRELINSIALDGLTNVPVNTSIVANFFTAQNPSTTKMKLSPSPAYGLYCTWTNGYTKLTCSSNIMPLRYGTTYTASIYNVNDPNPLLYPATATFKTQYAVFY